MNAKKLADGYAARAAAWDVGVAALKNMAGIIRKRIPIPFKESSNE